MRKHNRRISSVGSGARKPGIRLRSVHIGIVVWMLLGIVLAPSLARGQGMERSSWEVSSRFFAGFGPIDGYMQIPLGGAPDSSEKGRPTFSELSIDKVDLYDLEISLRYGAYRLYGGIQPIDLSSSGVLRKDLLTRNQQFVAGEHFDTKDQLDWYRLGLERSFDISDTVAIGVMLEFISLDLEYQFEGESVKVRRAIQRGGARLGVSGTWSATERVTVEAQASASVPDSSQPQITVLQGVARYRVTPPDTVLAAELFAGLAYERIEYEDDQKLPNHVKADLGPLGLAGVAITF